MSAPLASAGKMSWCPKCKKKVRVPDERNQPARAGAATPRPPGRAVANARHEVLTESVQSQLDESREALETKRRFQLQTLLGGAGVIAGVVLSSVPTFIAVGVFGTKKSEDALLLMSVVCFMLPGTGLGAVFGVLAGGRVARRMSASRSAVGVAPDGLAPVSVGGPDDQEKSIWECRLVRSTGLAVGGISTGISAFFLLVSLSGGGKVVVKLTDFEIPAWVLALAFFASVGTLAVAAVRSIWTRLTITSHRTVYRDPMTTIEIPHAERGAVEVTESTVQNVQAKGIAIRSSRTEGPSIAIDETGHADHIKKLLDALKQSVAAGSAEPDGPLSLDD